MTALDVGAFVNKSISTKTSNMIQSGKFIYGSVIFDCFLQPEILIIIVRIYPPFTVDICDLSLRELLNINILTSGLMTNLHFNTT